MMKRDMNNRSCPPIHLCVAHLHNGRAFPTPKTRQSPQKKQSETHQNKPRGVPLDSGRRCQVTALVNKELIQSRIWSKNVLSLKQVI